MEDYNVANNDTALTMSVSQIYRKDGEKIAYVTFKDNSRYAEGIIPACKITKSEGFDDKEVVGLEFYMKSELASLKKMAASIHTLDAIVGDE